MADKTTFEVVDRSAADDTDPSTSDGPDEAAPSPPEGTDGVGPEALREPEDEVVVEVDGLAKTYPDGTEAVEGVSLQVGRGEIYGVLGPNGAGKTTLVGMLGTLIRPTSGSAAVLGHDVETASEAIEPRLGYALQEVGVDEMATGREFLHLQGRLYGLDQTTAGDRADRLLDLLDLEEAADKLVEDYSGGMRRKVDLAGALIHEPEVVFLDEPTEGLDPRARRHLWGLLESLQEDLDATILLTTHYMEEADHLCDRLAIMDRGEIVARGAPDDLKAQLGRAAVVLGYDGDEEGARHAEELLVEAGIDGVRRTDSTLRVPTGDPSRYTIRLLRALDDAEASPETLRVQEPTLDDVYLDATGRSLEEAEREQEEGASP
jgi:ABC-2 type transport system ATP-binding protein